MTRRAIIFVLDPAEAAAATTLCERSGYAAFLFAPSYDRHLSDHAPTGPVALPRDYLTPEDVDRHYAAAFEWQKRMPATRLKSGKTLEAWNIDPALPTALWSWLPALYPHVHLRIRLIDTVLKVVEAERPDAFVVAGADPAFPWQGPLIRGTLAASHPALRELSAQAPARGASPLSRLRPIPRISAAKIAGAFASQASLEQALARWNVDYLYETGNRGASFKLEGARLRISTQRDYKLGLEVPVTQGGLTAAITLDVTREKTSARVAFENQTIRLDVFVAKGLVTVASEKPMPVPPGPVTIHVKMLNEHVKVTVNGSTVLRPRRLPSTARGLFELHHLHGKNPAPIETSLVLSTAGKDKPSPALTLFRSLRGLLRATGRVAGDTVVRSWRQIDADALAEQTILEKKEKKGGALALAALQKWTSKLPAAPRRVILIMRGQQGSQWFFSPVDGEWTIHDHYIEGMPEALIAACRERGLRLLIVYEGRAPVTDDERRGYAQRYPDVVDEMQTYDFRGLFSDGRSAATRHYREDVAKLLADPALRSAFSHRGINYFEGMRSIVEAEAVNRSAVFNTRYRAWVRFLGVVRPGVIFAGRLESRPELNQGAHLLGMRTTSVKLGIGEEMLPSFTAFKADGAFDDNAFPDVTLVWGEPQKRFLAERLPEYKNAIEVSGRTRNDSFAREAEAVDIRAVRKRAGLRQKDRVVLFGATSRTRYGLWPGGPYGTCCMAPKTMEESLRALLRAADHVPRMRVVVKPHPADSLEMISDMLARIGDPRLTLITDAAGFHNFELLRASDLFVSSVSSMFAEATLCGRVSVNIWTPDVGFLYEQRRHDTYDAISLSVESMPALTEQVVQLLTNPGYRRSELKRALSNVADLVGSSDGGNAARAVAFGLQEVTTWPEAADLPNVEEMFRQEQATSRDSWIRAHLSALRLRLRNRIRPAAKGLARTPAAAATKAPSVGTSAVFADLRVDVQDLFALLEREAPGSSIVCVCANYATERALRARVNDHPELSARISVREVVVADSETAGEGYIYARDVGYAAAACLRESFKATAGSPHHQEILDSFADSLSDSLQARLRPALNFRNLLVERPDIDRIIVVADKTPAASRFIRHLAEEISGRREWWFGDGKVIAPYAVPKSEEPLGPWLAKALKFAAEHHRKSPALRVLDKPLDVMIIASMRSGLYSRSLLPILKAMKDGRIVQIVGSGTPASERDHIRSDVSLLGVEMDFFGVEFIHPPSAEAVAAFKDATPRLLSRIAEQSKLCPPSLRDYALITGFANSPNSYGYAEAVWNAAEERCKAGLGALIVSPSRLLEPRVFVRRARAWGIRSIDLQFGTLSSSPKFLSPVADRVLAQDPAAFDLLRDHFAVEPSRLVLTGTPKTDELLATYGTLEKADARAKLGIETGRDDPVVLFASQTFSDQKMGQIVTNLLQASKIRKFRLIVKLHPAEDERRKAMFEEIGAREDAGADLAVVDSGDTFAYVRAADVVATYCSAIGMEAFALDRPVLMVDPFDEPAPVDLHELGVAVRVRTPKEIAGLVADEASAPGSILAAPASESILRQRALMREVSDGRAIDRIVEEVDRARAIASDQSSVLA